MKKIITVVVICAALVGAFAIGRLTTSTTTPSTTEAETRDTLNLNDVDDFTVDGNELHIYTNSGDEYLIIK